MESSTMAEVTPLPSAGTAFLDVRDEGRSLRVSWHPAMAAFAISFWRDDKCAASFWLPATDAPRLVETIVAALAANLPPAAGILPEAPGI